MSVVSDGIVASDAQLDFGLCVPGVHFRWAPDIVVGAILDFFGCIVLEPVVLLELVASSAKVATWQVGRIHLTLSCLKIYLSGIGEARGGIRSRCALWVRKGNSEALLILEA